MAWSLVFAPFVLGLLYVHLYGVNVVVNDQWEMAPHFKRLASGELNLLDLWEPHNEHRFFFPRLAMLLLGTVTEWNTVAEMYLIQICLLVTMVALLLAFVGSVGLRPLLFVPVAFLVFSLRQWENLLWGYQITFAFAQTFGVLTLYFLHLSQHGSRARWAFPAALAAGTVAAGSAIQGLLVWPAGLLQLFISPIRGTAKRIMIGVWSLIGLGEWVLYFQGYESRQDPSSLLYLLNHPAQGAGYFLAILGNWLFLPNQAIFAFLSGLLLFGFVAAGVLLIYKNGNLTGYSFWISLLFFSFLMLASITAGRYELGVPALLTSRYATFSLLAVVATYAVLVKLALERRSRLTGALLGVLATVILLVNVPISYYAGVKVGAVTETSRTAAAYILRTYESQPNSAMKLVRKSNAQRVKKRGAPILERLGYNVFSRTRGVNPTPGPVRSNRDGSPSSRRWSPGD